MPLDQLNRLIELGRHQVPGLWQRILPEEIFWAKTPDERLANCRACFKVARKEFAADCQCCTYFPQLPNFAVGLGLEDSRAAGRLSEMIDAGHMLPLGMMASPAKFRVAAEAYAQDLFGRLAHMVCPFVEPGTFDCAIYPYRNSVCSTFFCAHDHGEPGEGYWYKVQTLVGHVEIALSQWALDQVGLPAREVIARLNTWGARVPESFDEASGAWSLELRKHVWGDWFGRERDLFAACANLLCDENLFEVACEQPFLEALGFDRGVRQWIPAEYRDAVPEVAHEAGHNTPIDMLWYETQLTHRRLWALPFNEGTVRLSNQALIEINAGATRLAHLDPPRDLSPTERAALQLFKEPQVLGEPLFATAEIEVLDDARGFLAECMRRGVLMSS